MAIIDAVADSLAALRPLDDRPVHLRIGTFENVFGSLTTLAIEMFSARASGAKIELISARADQLVDLVESGEIDIALSTIDEPDHTELRSTGLMTEGLTAIVPQSHEWRGAQPIPIDDLLEHRMLHWNVPSLDAVFGLDGYRNGEIGHSVMTHAENVPDVERAVASTSAIGLVSAASRLYYLHPSTTYVDVANSPQLTLGTITKRHALPLATAFEETMRDVVRAHHDRHPTATPIDVD